MEPPSWGRDCCPPVCPSTFPSVHPFILPSFCPSVYMEPLQGPELYAKNWVLSTSSSCQRRPLHSSTHSQRVPLPLPCPCPRPTWSVSSHSAPPDHSPWAVVPTDTPCCVQQQVCQPIPFLTRRGPVSGHFCSPGSFPGHPLKGPPRPCPWCSRRAGPQPQPEQQGPQACEPPGSSETQPAYWAWFRGLRGQGRPVSCVQR